METQVIKPKVILEKQMMECASNGKGLDSVRTKIKVHVRTSTLGINGALIGSLRPSGSPKATGNPKARKEKQKESATKAKMINVKVNEKVTAKVAQNAIPKGNAEERTKESPRKGSGPR